MKILTAAILFFLFTATPLLADSTPIPSDVGKPILRDSAPAAPAAPTAAPTSSMDFDSGRVALALIGVVGLILLMRYAAKLVFPGAVASGRNRTVTVLARCNLAPRQHVVLIQVGRRIVVVADCASQLSSLCQITDPDEVAALLGQIQSDKSAPIGSPFTAWFNRAAEAFGQEHAHDETPQNDAESTEISKLTDRVRGLARQWASQQNP